MTSAQLKKDLGQFADAARGKILARFFKTGKGEYGEGDVFLGVTVPQSRSVARKYRDLSLNDLRLLLQSRIHEHRLTALLILAEQFGKAAESGRKKIVGFYLRSTDAINNWDLVDVSAYAILGEWLHDKPKDVLHRLATSANLWERRISMVATYAFIRRRQVKDAFSIAERLLRDEHDLMHKAVGWMLREAGKRDPRALRRFLDRHAATMPRTMLRYAIERFPVRLRTSYLRARRHADL